MSEPDIARMIGRLERAVEEGQRENARQFSDVRMEQAEQKVAIARLADSYRDLDKRVARTEGVAASATRKADASSHEIEVLNVSIIRHIAGMEASMSEAKSETSARLDAQDKVLAAQNSSLSGIHHALAEQSKMAAAAAKTSNARLGIYAAIIIAAIPVVDHTLVPLLSFWLK